MLPEAGKAPVSWGEIDVARPISPVSAKRRRRVQVTQSAASTHPPATDTASVPSTSRPTQARSGSAADITSPCAGRPSASVSKWDRHRLEDRASASCACDGPTEGESRSTSAPSSRGMRAPGRRSAGLAPRRARRPERERPPPTCRAVRPAARGPAHAPIHGAGRRAPRLRYAAWWRFPRPAATRDRSPPMQFHVERLQPIPAQFGTQVRPPSRRNPGQRTCGASAAAPASAGRCGTRSTSVSSTARVSSVPAKVSNTPRAERPQPHRAPAAALERRSGETVEAPPVQAAAGRPEEQWMHIGRARVPVELRRPGLRRAGPTHRA